MQNDEQRRAEALARIAANKDAAAKKAAREAKISAMRRTGQMQALMVACGLPMVHVGGNGLNVLREDVFDAANNTNGRAGLIQDTSATYDSAMMGGEPYAVWH